MALIDIEKKCLNIYLEAPWEEGSWFFGISAFRQRWEFGLMRDYDEGYTPSRYFWYLTRFNHEGLRQKQWEFPRKNRWSHVTR